MQLKKNKYLLHCNSWLFKAPFELSILYWNSVLQEEAISSLLTLYVMLLLD